VFYNIEGGLSAWQEAGLPLISTEVGTKLSIFRQVQIIMGTLIALLIGVGLYVDPIGFIFAGGLSLLFALSGITGWCGLGLLLNKMPWNR
jgi:hypothetical protein